MTGERLADASIFRLLVESVRDYAIFLLDPQGRVATWNLGAERIKGYRAEEIVGEHFSRFYPADVVERGWPEQELAIAAREGRFEDEGWRVRKDGSLFWASVVISAVHDEDGRLLGFAKVTRDLTQRRRVEALERAERQMTEFLALLAHELRNPLAPIRNAVELLAGAPPDPATLEWSRDVLGRQVGHLTRLVDDLLDVSRIASGKILIRRQPLDLAEVARGAADAARAWTHARQQELELSLPPAPVAVQGDATRLLQVITNLLSNAAKYTPAGRRIELSVAAEDNEAVLSVRDQGVGISPTLLPRVFDLFVQGERDLDRSEGGLGIGLTVVARLVRLHGGRVEAHSEGPGRGSEFVVRLPLREPVEPAPERPGHARPAPGGRRVLVVDDNVDSAASIGLLIRKWGHDVAVAHDAATAIENARELRPDTVLLDIGLPLMDGYELAQRLRELPGLAGVELIAMTGYGQAEDRQRSHAAGFRHHMVKPLDLDLLQRRLAAPPAD